MTSEPDPGRTGADDDGSPRRIIHIDMDAFYASVEQRDDPALRGKPVAVGGARERGVVAAASYEARRFGVHSAMPSVTARRKCPELIFVKPRFDVYPRSRADPGDLRRRYTPLIEPLSLDEAYLDVTRGPARRRSATAIARDIRAAIRATPALTASAGVSYNKFLAKLASDHRKPDGLFVITPRMGPAFVETLPVGRFHGVGPATAARMARLGIATGARSAAQSLDSWAAFRQGRPLLLRRSRGGIDRRPVRANRIRKSVGAENTFGENLHELDAMNAAFAPILDKVWRSCDAHGLRGRTVTLKVKYEDFQIVTRRITLPAPVAGRTILEETSLALLRPLLPPRKGVRLLGVSVSGFEPASRDAEAKQMRFAL